MADPLEDLHTSSLPDGQNAPLLAIMPSVQHFCEKNCISRLHILIAAATAALHVIVLSVSYLMSWLVRIFSAEI